jgi:hypothetical protein
VNPVQEVGVNINEDACIYQSLPESIRRLLCHDQVHNYNFGYICACVRVYILPMSNDTCAHLRESDRYTYTS